MPHPSLQSRVVKLDNARYHGGFRTYGSIDLIVMHCTAGGSAMSSIEWMNRPSTDSPTSYHYLIERQGTIYRMCGPTIVAYHAGDSAFPADPHKAPHQGSSVNKRSLGIAFANRNDGEPLTPSQIESGLWLCGVFCRDEQVPIAHVRGHSEVAPGRKTDPDPAIRMDHWRDLLAAYLND